MQLLIPTKGMSKILKVNKNHKNLMVSSVVGKRNYCRKLSNRNKVNVQSTIMKCMNDNLIFAENPGAHFTLKDFNKSEIWNICCSIQFTRNNSLVLYLLPFTSCHILLEIWNICCSIQFQRNNSLVLYLLPFTSCHILLEIWNICCSIQFQRNNSLVLYLLPFTSCHILLEIWNICCSIQFQRNNSLVLYLLPFTSCHILLEIWNICCSIQFQRNNSLVLYLLPFTSCHILLCFFCLLWYRWQKLIKIYLLNYNRF